MILSKILRGNGSGEDYIMGSFLICSHQILVIKPYRMRWAGPMATYGGEEGVYRGLLGKTWVKETTGKT